MKPKTEKILCAVLFAIALAIWGGVVYGFAVGGPFTLFLCSLPWVLIYLVPADFFAFNQRATDIALGCSIFLNVFILSRITVWLLAGIIKICLKRENTADEKQEKLFL